MHEKPSTTFYKVIATCWLISGAAKLSIGLYDLFTRSNYDGLHYIGWSLISFYISIVYFDYSKRRFKRLPIAYYIFGGLVIILVYVIWFFEISAT